jgi:hypothetical protein
MWTAIGLGILWGLCAIFWVMKLSQIIQVQRPVKPEATVRA